MKNKEIRNFLGGKIDVSYKVFRPRVETEFWVKKAIKDLKKRFPNTPIKVLDIFAGTGCIGIAVLKNIKNSWVDFVDISPWAIKQIKKNLKLNQISSLRYQVYQGNLFVPVKGKRYEAIFANPPYVALERIDEIEDRVLKTEPKQALFAGRKGMVFIKKFLAKVEKYLKPKGIVYMEFDPFQKKEIEKILKKQDFSFSFYKDQFGKWRWLGASLKLND